MSEAEENARKQILDQLRINDEELSDLSEEVQSELIARHPRNTDNLNSLKAVDLMQTIPTTLLTQISRDTADYKAFIKVPLILIMALSGTMAAHVVSLFKCATEIMHADGQVSPIGLTLFLLGVSAASFEIVLTNLAMKYYKQIEVIPIFQCFYFVMNITFGMLLLGEAKFYTT